MTSLPQTAGRLPQWVRTDEWADVASSLEHLAMSLGFVTTKPQEWKWAIIACHSALQGALICVLSGSNGIGCLTDRAMAAVLQWVEESRTNPDAKQPDERVAELPVLLTRARDKQYMSEFGGAPISLDDNASRDLDLLHLLRNRFTHFRPSSWNIEITGLPRIIQTAIKLTQRIMFGHPACTIRLDDEQLMLFTSRFQDVSNALKALGAPGLPILVSEPEHLISR